MPCGRSGPASKAGFSFLRSMTAVRAVDFLDSPTPPPPSTITFWSCAGGSSSEAAVSSWSVSASPGTLVKVFFSMSHIPGARPLSAGP